MRSEKNSHERTRDGEHRQRHERTRKPVQLDAGTKAEDHEQWVQAQRVAHHVRDDDVPLDLVDAEKENRNPERGDRMHDRGVANGGIAPSHGPRYGIISVRATNAPNRSTYCCACGNSPTAASIHNPIPALAPMIRLSAT